MVLGTILRILCDAALLCVRSKLEPGDIVNNLAGHIETASSFSLLAFLPLGPKVSYWWSHREYIMCILLWDPPILHGESMWRKQTWTGMIQGNTFSVILRVIAKSILMIVIQVVVPFLCLVFPLLAPFAFLVKMQALPDVNKFQHWSSSEWLAFLGVLNQTSKLWDINMVEQNAMLRLFRDNTEKALRKQGDEEGDAKPGQIMREIAGGACQSLGKLRALIFMSNLDSSLLDTMLNQFVTVSHRSEEKAELQSPISELRKSQEHTFLGSVLGHQVEVVESKMAHDAVVEDIPPGGCLRRPGFWANNQFVACYETPYIPTIP